MVSYLTLNNLKASMYNVRLVASVLSTKNNRCTIQKVNSANLHILPKEASSQEDRLPPPNNNDPAKVTRLSPQRPSVITDEILSHRFQFGPTRSKWASYKETFVNENKGIMQGMYNSSRKINMYAMNNGGLTRACLDFWYPSQPKIRSYSTGSSDKKEDVKPYISTSDGSVIDKDNKQVPLSRKEMLKKAIKDYGSTVLVFYIGISLISFGSIYLLLSSGLDVVAILQHFGWGDSALSNKLAAGASTVVVAYAIHLLFASVRLSITLASAPFIVRYLRNKGILKKPTGSK